MSERALGKLLRRTGLIVIGAMVGWGSSASGAVLATDSTSSIILPSVERPLRIESGQPFTLFAWIRPNATPVGESNVITIDGVFELRCDAAGVTATLRRSAGAPLALAATAPLTLPGGKWALLAASFNPAQGSLLTIAQHEGGGRVSGVASSAGFLPGIGGVVSIGATPSVDGVGGAMAIVTVRTEPISAFDFDRVWAAQRQFAPYDLKTTNQGGALTGESGCRWMVHHAICTGPSSALDQSVNGSLWASFVGGPVTPTNFIILNKDAAQSPSAISVVRNVQATNGYTFASAHEGELAGFFRRPLPNLLEDLPEPAEVSGVAPRARRLFEGPSGLCRVMTSANSRAVRRNDGSGASPGNFAHGFMAVMEDQIAGVMNVPPFDARTAWFGFDCEADRPFQSGAITGIGASDFSRFWTNSTANSGRGPGAGLLLHPGAQFAMRCRPQGLIEATAPLMVRAHVIRYPGSAPILWVPNKHLSPADVGTDVGAASLLVLDTTEYSTEWSQAGGDEDLPSLILLDGDRTAQVDVGDAVSVREFISVVSATDFGATAPGKTAIQLEHPLGGPLIEGDTLRFGDWGVETIEHLWPGLAESDPSIWRGLRLEAGGKSGDAPLLLVAMDGWRPDVDGFVFATSGWAGNGYDSQLEQTFAAATAMWMQAVSPDVWLQMFAPQESSATTMSDFAATVRATVPYADLLWLGDVEHGSANEPWHHYVIDHSAEMDIPSVTLIQHPAVGTQEEQFADGLRADGNHLSQRGNELLATLWLDALSRIALPASTPGDANHDSLVNFADLNIVLSEFNTLGQGLGGDVDFDNDVDFADLNLVISGFNAAP